MSCNNKLKIILVSTPIGYLGSGKGGGVELTLISLIKGLTSLGHSIVLVAPEGSEIDIKTDNLEIQLVTGVDQPSWQHQDDNSPIIIPSDGILPKLLDKAIRLSDQADAILNMSYDWLPIWITPYISSKLFHLISMGSESMAMKTAIRDLSLTHHKRMAFHTKRQANDYELSSEPIVVGNGFDMKKYDFYSYGGGPLGWAGRIAPEKGLEDAVKVASILEDKLLVWGFMEDPSYASYVEELVPSGTIDWRGFLPTDKFQEELRTCRAFINTPKWNEAYGNVVIEAMACGVPVVAYDKGGPGELIQPGLNGFVIQPDNISEMVNKIKSIGDIDRKKCRELAEDMASHLVFSERVSKWIVDTLLDNKRHYINSEEN